MSISQCAKGERLSTCSGSLLAFLYMGESVILINEQMIYVLEIVDNLLLMQ